MVAYSTAGQFAFGILSGAIEFMNVHEREETQREYIRAHRDVLVTALNNGKRLPTGLFRQTLC